MKASVSFNVGTKTSISHNNRDNLYGNPDINVDKIKDNIYYIQKDIKELYQEVFNSSVGDYNKSQKREDRKIKDYYKKVLNDKKTEVQREIIVAVGRHDDNIPVELKRDILNQYMTDFQNRNESMKVYNAVMHLDEKNPHLHINYVPVATYNKGLKQRVSQKRVVKELGFDTFEDWRNSETSHIEKLMNEKGIERHSVGSHKYLNVKEYKECKDDIKLLEKQLKALERDLKASQIAKGQIDHIDSMEAKKSPLGAKVSLKQDDYEVLMALAKESIKNANEIGRLKNKIQELKNENKDLNEDIKNNTSDEVRELREENSTLKIKVQELKNENEELSNENTKLGTDLDFVKKQAKGFRTVIDNHFDGKNIINEVRRLVNAPQKNNENSRGRDR